MRPVRGEAPISLEMGCQLFPRRGEFLKSLNDFGQKIDEIKRTGVFKELKIHCINGF
jgi:hypothetical protein